MDSIQVFQNEEFGEIRVVTIDGEPWMVGKDVAAILKYERPGKAVVDHVDEYDRKMLDGKTQSQFGIELGQRGGWLINESGLYSLVLSSQLPTAKKFKRWVTSEVLPSIRKHGAYMTPETLEQILMNPDTIIKLATALKEEQEQRKALETENQIMKPKADYFDSLVDRNLLTNFRDTAKEFGMKQKAFISLLLKNGYLYRDAKNKLKPYADKNDGLFELKEWTNILTGAKGVQTLVTPKGRETFRLLVKASSEA